MKNTLLLDIIKAIYSDLLNKPPEVRLQLQESLAMCRDAIAGADGIDPQIVQDYFDQQSGFWDRPDVNRIDVD